MSDLDNIHVIGLYACSTNLINTLHGSAHFMIAISSTYIDFILQISDVAYNCDWNSHTLHLWFNFKLHHSLKNMMSLCQVVQSPVEGCPGPAKGLGRKKIIEEATFYVQMYDQYVPMVRCMPILSCHEHLVVFSYLSHMFSYDTLLSHISYIWEFSRTYETHMRIYVSYENIWERYENSIHFVYTAQSLPFVNQW